jgi:L-aminopeptidase/D-esterase-like protein
MFRPLLAVLVFLAVGAAPLQVEAQRDSTANETLTAVEGIRVGHHTLAERPTGCTVILVAGAGAVGGVSQRGGAPGTRETDLLDPLNLVDRVNAIVLAGGSAFGLDAATGVVRWLDEHDTGWPTPAGKVPIVPAAILYDLEVGANPRIRPTADCGYQAASSASAAPVQEGSVGAGAGAVVGQFARPRGGGPTKAGIGSAALRLPDGLVVGAVAAVNAAGDIVDPGTGRIVAGVRNADGSFADVRALLRGPGGFDGAAPGRNTTIAVVATNATLTKAEVNRVALMADDGLARAIVPSHTTGDGDTVFALATGSWRGSVPLSRIGALAADVMAQAIVRAGTQATGLPGLPAARDLRR